MFLGYSACADEAIAHTCITLDDDNRYDNAAIAATAKC